VKQRSVARRRSQEVAELAQSLADGESIVAVASFGEQEYPSTAPFRFGAWKSDAEVVARWDIGAWHHPRQLSRQVRAMVSARRPAVVLAPDVQIQGSAEQEQTLVGEAVWMKHNWFPLLDGATPLLDGPIGHQLAQLRTSEPFYEPVVM
jgi:hypothetical protein